MGTKLGIGKELMEDGAHSQSESEHQKMVSIPIACCQQPVWKKPGSYMEQQREYATQVKE